MGRQSTDRRPAPSHEFGKLVVAVDILRRTGAPEEVIEDLLREHVTLDLLREVRRRAQRRIPSLN